MNSINFLHGNAIDLIQDFSSNLDLLATDPPYAFGGEHPEHELSAAVAIVLRESGKKLKQGRWAVVFCASSWRSTNYMIEAMRGILTPIRIATWIKENNTSKARTTGWTFNTVNIIAFRKGKDGLKRQPTSPDYCICPPEKIGRRATLPIEVAKWAIEPFVVSGGVMLDPFMGAGRLCQASAYYRMEPFGFDIDPKVKTP